MICSCASTDTWHEKLGDWINHGGDIYNRRYAEGETRISPLTASRLRLKWKFNAGNDITATPAIFDGIVYFPSWNGFVYAVRAIDGSLVWKQNLKALTGLDSTLPAAFNITTPISRATPTIADDLLIIGIYGPAYVFALKRATGELVWKTQLDTHPAALITMSGTYYRRSFYVGVSSLEEATATTEDCCTFRGSFLKLDIRTGTIIWRTYMVLDNQGKAGGYAGAAIWGSSPSIDAQRNHVYIATGNLYSTPQSVEECQERQNNQTFPNSTVVCVDPANHFDSILALDLNSGQIKWFRQLGGYDVWFFACRSPSTPNCPAGPNPDADFGEEPMMLSANVNKTKLDIVVAVQKSGYAWALDRNNGKIVWSTEAGPGGTNGGGTWGAATDTKRVYTNIANNDKKNFTLLPSNAVTTGGGWVAMDPGTGRILWSTAVPYNATTNPVTIANGVLFAGSTYRTGPVYAIDGMTGAILWSYETGASVYGGLSVSRGCIYVGNGYRVVPSFTPGSSLFAFCQQIDLEVHAEVRISFSTNKNGNSASDIFLENPNVDLSLYPPDKVRNFSIIAHVDHGKSTLADRLLELTGTIRKGHGQPQYLDKLQVERERGITVKAQTATMFHRHDVLGSDTNFLLNLIDTPGHVDFSYEVSRSLAACQGVLLVVDAAQGVQAQTVANFYLAFEANLTIIPVINKIDQPTADPDRVKAQLKSMFDLDPNEALLTSAKTGQGLEAVLPAVIKRIPPPPGTSSSPLRMLLLDSYYDEYKGVICHVAVVDGALQKGDRILSAATGQSYEVLDVGIMHPELTQTGVLFTGQVGYVVSGMRSTKEARVGDTLYHTRSSIDPLPGFKPVKHMVFSGLYPADGSDFEALNHAIERLTCNDASVSVTKEISNRCGFLGLLHMDVFHQRLEQEHGAHVISTVPTVPYIFEYSDGSKIHIQNPATLPSNPKQHVTACWEPTVIATIIIPSEYVGAIITLCSERRGEQLEYSFIDSNQVSDLVKLDILLNGQPVDAMATIIHRSKAQRVGRELVEKLKKFIDRQMFEITIQAAIGSKVIARETISAMRKNVLAKCYGGDVTRKRKLLEKQKEGKKRMKRVGSVDIPQEAFRELLKGSS
ncbi:hypothetical protein F511_02307 [Dorcoceras hygrometricum]|uniref:Translation factor GUF1 homolog, mitochondrial n=1 Tax=Dorcoceras hygrometricum TaxID=472368 RepID=A0A2Z7CIB2_9LAMI|nr:hypothetical protein F511_02307 [Dorcoceras hygrometricum]